MFDRRKNFIDSIENNSSYIPVDFGGTIVSSITLPAYKELITYLEIEDNNPDFLDLEKYIVKPKEQLLKRWHIDTRILLPSVSKKYLKINKDNSIIDEWGIIKYRSKESPFFYNIKSPLQYFKINENLDKYNWPDPNKCILIDKLKKEAKKLYYNTEKYVIVLNLSAQILHRAIWLRSFEVFMTDLILHRSFAEKLLDYILEYELKRIKNILKAVGDYIQVAFIADDLGTQNAPLISPKLYKELLKPRQEKISSLIKYFSGAKILYHSCGSIQDFMGDLIEIGVDIINPIQVGAKGMEPKILKKKYGNNIVFWGAIDTQKVLPFGSVQEVKIEVLNRIKELWSNGGYIVSTTQNIQSDITPKNICTLFDTLGNINKNLR